MVHLFLLENKGFFVGGTGNRKILIDEKQRGKIRSSHMDLNIRLNVTKY